MCFKCMCDFPFNLFHDHYLMCYHSFRDFHGHGGSFHSSYPSMQGLGVATMEIDMPGQPSKKKSRSINEARYLTILAYCSNRF